ncbi:hypothetical protein TNCV_1545491 [Trichonephila clavipes]|nr:hypothetical protein TNCV_1545491 [Trichonephila clavipes]
MNKSGFAQLYFRLIPLPFVQDRPSARKHDVIQSGTIRHCGIQVLYDVLRHFIPYLLFATDSPHTNTIVITAEIEFGFVAKEDLVPFRCSQVYSCLAPLQTEASMGGPYGQPTLWAPRSQMFFS